jgi:tRNA(Arg) A34 adenosine deaminase TadA
VKNTQEWQETRAAYVVKLKDRLARDPEFAAIFRAEAAARTREWDARLRLTDPTRHAEMKAKNVLTGPLNTHG